MTYRGLTRYAGGDAVELLRDVLGDGMTIERAARERSDDTRDRIA
jgi:hypothetical protein